VPELHGPIKITTSRQISLPTALMDQLHLRSGDQVYVMQSDSEPDGLVIVPLERVSEWIRLGRAAERQDSRDPAERMQEDG
jgi:antitoxin component of MazEF toxin-antitoxin module